jgi:hypothetical protein
LSQQVFVGQIVSDPTKQNVQKRVIIFAITETIKMISCLDFMKDLAEA